MLFVRFVLYFFQEDKNNVCICIAKGDFLIPIFKIYQCDCEKLGFFSCLVNLAKNTSLTDDVTRMYYCAKLKVTMI